MRIVNFMLVMLLVGGSTFAQSVSGDNALGEWLSADKATRIEVTKSGDTYTGKMLWAKDMFEADGKTSKKDDKNGEVSLRGRERKNLLIISGLTYADGEYAGGSYYDIGSGSTYKCKMTLKDGKMLLRGYLGLPMMGRTYVWTRVQ